MHQTLNFGLRGQFPIVRQSGQAECGHACLAMVSTYFGRSMSLLEVRSIQAPSSRGMSLEHLMDLAARMHIDTRPIKIELEDLKKASPPLILHWSFNHFVVLVKADDKAVTIADPAMGLRVLSWEEVSKNFTGVAVDVSPNEKMPSKETQLRLTLSHLIGRVRGLASAGAHVIAVAAALELFALLTPLFGQVIADHVLMTKDSNLLLLIGLGFGAAVFMRTYLNFVRDWLILALSTSVRVQVASRLVSHVLRLPADFFEQRQSIDIQQRLESLNEIERTLASTFLQAFIDSLMAVVVLGLIFFYSTTLGVVAVVSMVAYATVRFSTLQTLRNARQLTVTNMVRQSSHLVETLRSVVPLKLANKVDWRLTQWKNLATETANSQIVQAKQEMLVRLSNTFLMGVASIVFLSVAGMKVMDGALTVGGLLALSGFYATISTRLSSFVDGYAQVKLLTVQLDRLADFVFTGAEERQVVATPVSMLERAPLSIELRNVSYRFSDVDPWILKDVNMRVEAGENVCITGPSGSGKSTLLKIMTGVFKPQSGEVLINGVSLDEFGLARLRTEAAVVLQNDRLYLGSIADNISFFDTACDQERVERSAHAASILHEIARMPMGLQTLCGEDGAGLSGGQAQRILIARALYRQPNLLLMDEATSSLDVPTEQKVSSAIRALKTTRVFIAHRPQTIASADRVFVLDNGMLMEVEPPPVKNQPQPPAAARTAELAAA